ncbi:DUF3040 domain-containing protein [Saccharopolyspora indica]|uniref:DUF3040 domain-containing protein n=1 Tax=Saccharopolyspora indica TaxID=1229659 RepID=UPI0022EB58AC|nr:DUF3040 domain-containing protein [Saccharopolyspora indica]MDA3644316.1 DUF3040 domain-containing protein [Saccharopolyspora indica]
MSLLLADLDRRVHVLSDLDAGPIGSVRRARRSGMLLAQCFRARRPGGSMLRRHERRLFDAIELRLRSEDPDFARRMAQTRLMVRVLAWFTLGRALGSVAAFLALVSLVLAEGAAFLVAGSLAAALFACSGRRVRSE